jgi:hypothetical protein
MFFSLTTDELIDECDAYIKTINPDFDPKTATVLKPKRYIKEK